MSAGAADYTVSCNMLLQPVVNQIEFHPYLQQPKLQDFLHQHSIVTEAYSPLAPLVHKPGGPVDAVIQQLADKYSRTTGGCLCMGQGCGITVGRRQSQDPV